MKHFKESEFVMGDLSVYDKMNEELLLLLDELRERVDEPLYITSSFRTKEYNDEIHGSSRSQHLHGKAVDLSCNNGVFRAKIVRHALELGLTVGVAKTFVHVDCRDKQIVFTY
jgi:uncharacterized protein YcbK (DUF882 family)